MVRQTDCLGNYIYGNTIKTRKSCSFNRQYIQVDSGLVDITAGDDFIGLHGQES
jgi:hypothetical protein